MEWLDILDAYFPPMWSTALHRITPSQRARVQEIRLRAEQPIVLSLPSGDCFLSVDGVCGLWQRGVLLCTQAQLDACFLRLCEESVYAHEEELRHGFLSVAGGIRVGVAGTAVGGTSVRSVRQITSLCIRLPRRHIGCAASIMPLIEGDSCLHSTVLVGAPSSGKTTLLRDIAETLAAHRWRVTVVDERGEIAGVDGLRGCDVLCRYPKPLGIRQAIRTLAPQAVIFDELGDVQEMQAVAECANAGVAVISSIHGEDPDTLSCRAAVRTLAAGGAFRHWLFLAGRRAPGVCVGAYRAEVSDDTVYWHIADRGGGDRYGAVCGAAVASAHGISATHGTVDAGDGAEDELYGSAPGHDVAWICRR